MENRLVYTKDNVKIAARIERFRGNCGLAYLWSLYIYTGLRTTEEVTPYLIDFTKSILNINNSRPLEELNLELFSCDPGHAEKKKRQWTKEGLYGESIGLLSKSKIAISDKVDGNFHQLAKAVPDVWCPIGDLAWNSNSGNKIRMWELNRYDENGNILHEEYML